MSKLEKCCYCKNIPTIIRIPGDLYYVQCSCGKHGAYDYLGATRNLAIDIWNKAQHTRSLYNKGDEE